MYCAVKIECVIERCQLMIQSTRENEWGSLARIKLRLYIYYTLSPTICGCPGCIGCGACILCSGEVKGGHRVGVSGMASSSGGGETRVGVSGMASSSGGGGGVGGAAGSGRFGNDAEISASG
jgi:hypothetical protein